MKTRQDGEIFKLGDKVSLTSDRTGKPFDYGVIKEFFLDTGVKVICSSGWIYDTWINRIEHTKRAELVA